MSQNKYIVPHDFTAVADAATHHALNLATQTGAAVELLHIVKSDKAAAVAEEKFAEILKSLELNYKDQTVTTNIAKGSIFSDIARIAEESNAVLVVMGTHGAKGMQKVMGSYALKVITSASVPFLVVQEKHPQGKVGRIVLPVDLTLESVQVMRVASRLAQAFESEIHIVGNKESDKTMGMKVNNHIKVVGNQMVKDGVNYKVKLLEGGQSLHQKVQEYGKEVQADMYAIAYHTESLLPQFDRFAQSMLMNEDEIPVLVINSKQVAKLSY
jgi:nucleotide-binding universal stress UspA family protein